ncbi:hypothetical protein Vretimale_17513 [Volvox reticuliferus]|uniref:Uncharacterized protein n=1 Tax=Volvox reticuliferus TaxID=1737510 RepID=A0A8J4LYH0_9CHLO|nr:hypothetical protein Vretimale_17513 [Volvox reticuliferus]
MGVCLVQDAGDWLPPPYLHTGVGRSEITNIRNVTAGAVGDTHTHTHTRLLQPPRTRRPSAPLPYHSPITSGPLPYHSPITSAPLPYHSPITSAPLPYHSPITSAPLPYHSPITSAPLPYHSPITSAPLPYHSPITSMPPSQLYEQDSTSTLRMADMDAGSWRSWLLFTSKQEHDGGLARDVGECDMKEDDRSA